MRFERNVSATALMKRGSPSPDLEGSATPATKRLSGADNVSRCSSWMMMPCAVDRTASRRLKIRVTRRRVGISGHERSANRDFETPLEEHDFTQDVVPQHQTSSEQGVSCRFQMTGNAP